MNELEAIANKLFESANQANDRVGKLTDEVFTIKDQQSNLKVDLTKLERDQGNFLKLWESEKGNFDKEISKISKHFDNEIGELKTAIMDMKKAAWSALWKGSGVVIGALAVMVWFYHTSDIKRDNDMKAAIIQQISEIKNAPRN